MWESILLTIREGFRFFGGIFGKRASIEPEPVSAKDAAAARQGTESGVAATNAGRKAGH